LREPAKHWKFNPGDLAERKLWPLYQEAFQQCLQETSTKYAPWYVIPADDKWYARATVADIIAAKLESLELKLPEVSEVQRSQFSGYIKQLEQQ
jgi:polyphosphate kinase 2 (PPK2 family)